METKRIVSLGTVISLGLIAHFFFQNCSPIHFSKDYSSVSVSSSIAGDGSYTNSRILPLKVEVSTTDFDEVRASIHKDMDTKSIPWVKLKGKKEIIVEVDLAEQFTADGSLDGEKFIFVESRESSTGKVMNTETIAYLDTQTPTMSAKGLLVNGIQGLVMSKDQPVSLIWDSADKVASSGFSSGIKELDGFRWGISSNGDCSEASLVSKSEWGKNVKSLEVPWPEADPLNAFYFCLYVKDRAGNIGNALSQPMTSLWNVVAGDNSQGNGSSVTSNKVRFKLPYYMFLDANADIQFYDSAFASYRTIKNFSNDTSRTIEQSKFIGAYSTAAVVDSAKNTYYSVNSELYILKNGENTAKKFILKDSAIPAIELAIRKVQGVESLLIGRSKLMDPAVDCKCYLLEIPLSEIAGLIATPSTFDAAITKYRIAGNGFNAPTSAGVTNDIKLTKSDSSTDNQKALGFINGLVAGDNGDIYIATGADGAARGWGVHSIRRLRSNSDGSLQQTILIKNYDAPATTFIRDLAYRKQVTADGSVKEFLFAGSAYGVTFFDLVSGAKSKPFLEAQSSVNHSQITTALVVPILGGKDFELYFGSGTESKIFRYDSSFKLIEALGRSISDVNPNDALASVLANPDGITVNKENGDIYMVDSQTGVIQKIDKAGKIGPVYGTYSDNSYFLSGYFYRIEGDFDSSKNRKVLYFNPNFNASLHQPAKQLDLNTGVASLLYPEVTAKTDPNYAYDWTLNSFALIKNSNDKNVLLMKRTYPIATETAYNAGFTSFVEKINLNGTVPDVSSRENFLGDIMKGEADQDTAVRNPSIIKNSTAVFPAGVDSKTVVDSTQNIYTSGSYLLISRLDSDESRMLNWKIGTNFTVVEGLGSLRYIIYRNGLALGIVKVDLEKLSDPAQNPILESKKLCFPGSVLRGSRDITQDEDGNLLISDSNNARVIRYRIRDATGSLKFSYCP